MADDVSRIQGGDGAKFNSSLATLERIDSLLKIAYGYASQGLNDSWLTTLETLDSEVYPFLDAAQRQTIEASRPQNAMKLIPVRGGSSWARRTVAWPRSTLLSYERTIRQLLADKGFLMVAGKSKGSVILGGGD